MAIWTQRQVLAEIRKRGNLFVRRIKTRIKEPDRYLAGRNARFNDAAWRERLLEHLSVLVAP